ncbi:MAG: peptidase domain-containing ABC transporter [Bacteroidales bacterium]|nr:peptidase domain-containing ABC transporter [Bacteroidales bacterium]
MKPFKFIKQRDSMGCGVACLAMICNHYGLCRSVDKIEKFCQPTKDGISLKGISDAAQTLGLKTLGIRIGLNDLDKVNLPIVLHWNQNHFVVLYRISNKGKRFWIADPGKGKYHVSIEELKENWLVNSNNQQEKGLAMIFEPTESFYVETTTKKETNKSFVFLWQYILQYKNHLAQILLGLLVGCILQLIMPFLTQWIVDLGIRHNDIKLIWLILFGEFMIVVGRTATDFIRRWLLLHISMRVNISLVSDFFIKLLKLPMAFFDTKLMGDLLQRMNDHSRVQSFLTTQTLSIMFTLLSFIVFGLVLFIYSKVIFLIFILGSILYGLWIARFLSQRKILDYELFEQEAINQNRTYQFINSMQEIKLQDCERRRRWEWEDTQAGLFNLQMKSMKLQQTQEAGSIFINEIKNILITVFAATSVINNQISLGAMLAIQYIVGQLNSPVEQLMAFIYSLQDVKISLERINEIHGNKNEESNENQIKKFNSAKTISLDGIDFKYDLHSLKKTIEDVSFNIPEGKVTAIVGASGSGKTTLIKLMLGYYSLLSGTISIAGRNINEYNLKWWRQQCGVVMQDGVIFSESIARNIAVTDDRIDWGRLEQAAKIANIYDYIMTLPLKYETKIGSEGVGLSQGQKQRILIARAVYKKPNFIFLDEATNALDAKNERVIVEKLDKFYEGRTVVVVAHRLSTVKNADQIIVLDNGTVVEIGNHTDLIKKRGYYYNLIKNQLELGN